ncbi:hypothetical protein MKZ38_005871 [Zalerion maritima]|uniref:Microbial-type PARG catalytic domain-containing protein n=1 Tax=Zalerion maritima TaxID=339359 RepID=A0AAD5RJM9_9PEZI|nr:hypothetical protein MKZ38_005871 [Zalerion maritima]
MASSSHSTSGSRSARHGSSSKPRPSDIATEAKKIYIPEIKKTKQYPTFSHLFRQPLVDLVFSEPGSMGVVPPNFYVDTGDAIDYALAWQKAEVERTGVRSRIPFLCPAHERKPAGEWETNAPGYEEQIARRSNLSAVLATPADGQGQSNYPIPMEGGILSDTVVLFRGAHPTYQVLQNFEDLPVVSVHPMARPKLTHNGSKYSFQDERDIVKNKLRAGLRIILWQGYTSVVVGDFGLGPYKNPPQELAELWRDVFLYDPDLRGKFRHVAFVFADSTHSTMNIIAEDIAKKNSSSSSSGKGKSKSKKDKDHGGSGSSSGSHYPSDYAIFFSVFDNSEIQRVLSSPDPRLGLGMITS